MKVRLTNLITLKTRTYRATMTTDHPASSYGLPVMVLRGSGGSFALDVTSAVLQAATLVELPRRKSQLEMLRQWQEAAQSMIAT